MVKKRENRYTRFKGLNPDIIRIAKERTKWMFDLLVNNPETRMQTLLANAYLQGIADATEALGPK